ncbi:MAG: c-type cytochrome biogenesis protein CcmI [Gammaproteobacteria bacterium]|nr:MAG: c-type cytochrome biogenesis protein CcmI [Gammaproteobacteria bacterium]
MTPFLMITGSILAVVLLLLILPLLRRDRQAPPSDDTRQHDIRIARERLEELRKEHAQGELSDEEFEQAKVDLEITLAQDLEAAEKRAVHVKTDRAARLTIALVIVLIPAIVAGVYLHTGAPDLLDPAKRVAAATPQAQSPHAPASIAELVAELERRMQQDPSNPKGWFLLGRTYMQLNRYDDAVKAFQKLDELLPDNPTVLISLADALSMQNGGKVPEKAVKLLDRVLKIEPDNVTALWLRGNAAGQRHQDAEALRYWSRAYPLLGGEPAMQHELRQLISAVEARSGLKADLPEAAAAAVAKASPPGAAEGPQKAAGGSGLQVEVALDPALMDKISPDDLVFIYAKATSGPPMPLAVARKRVSDLPVKVVLNDGMAMMPQMRLSAFPKVKVGARVSKSGRPIAQPGDLQSAEIETANDNKKPIQLVINQVR